MTMIAGWIKMGVAAIMLASAPAFASDSSNVMVSNFIVIRKTPASAVTPQPAPAAPAPAAPTPVAAAPVAPAKAPIATSVEAPAKVPAPPPPKEVHTRECAKNLEEFKQCPMLIKVLGEKYDPFSHWTSSAGAEILPSGKNSMYVKVPPMGKMFGYKDAPLPMEICVDASKPDEAYMMSMGVKHKFDDAKGNRMTLSDGAYSTTFVRVGAGASR